MYVVCMYMYVLVPYQVGGKSTQDWVVTLFRLAADTLMNHLSWVLYIALIELLCGDERWWYIM